MGYQSSSNGDSKFTRRTVVGVLTAVAASPLAAARSLTSRSQWRRNIGTLPEIGGEVYPRYLHASVGLSDGSVVVIGGYAASEATFNTAAPIPTSSVQLYDPRADTWYDLAPLKMPRARHAAVALPGGRIAVFGGYLNGPLSSTEIYDPRTNKWSFGEPLPAPMADHAASLSGDSVVLTGGQHGYPALIVSALPVAGADQP